MGDNKTQKLIKAWLQFMDLEENQKIEVPPQDCLDPKEDEWSLKGNMLRLSEHVFQRLKRAYQTEHSGDGAENARGIYVTFPLLEGFRQMRIPLFGISMDEILQGEYTEDGWDLTQQPSFCAMRNMVASFDVLTEDNIADLDANANPLSLLSAVATKHFSKKIHSLWELYEVIGAWIKGRHTERLYVFWRSETVVAKNLKTDLNDALKSELKNMPLVEQLLYGKSPQDPGQRFVYGRLGKIPAKTQREALVHQYNHALTVVQGPPGSGKTTLIMNAIASYVAQSYLGQRSKLPIVITSSTNKAVDNVRDKFQEMELGDYYLELGSAQKSQAAKKLISAMIETLQSTTDEDLSRKIKDNKSRITSITNQIWGQTDTALEERKSVESRITKLEKSLERLTEQFGRLTVPELDSSALEEGLKYLQALISQLQGRSIVSKLLRGKGLSVEEIELGTKAVTCLRASGAVVGEQTEDLLTPQQWMKLWNDMKAVKSAWVETTETKEKIAQVQETMRSEKEALQKLQDSISVAEQQLYSEDIHALQERLFYEIVAHNRLIAQQNKQSVVVALNRYQEYMDGKGTVSKDDLYWVFMCFPCIGTTLHSFRRCFPFAPSLIGKLIVDEAGMISINQLFPAVCRAETMLVVGDTKQLEPVVTVAVEDQQRYRDNAFYAQGLTDDDYYAYSPLSPGTATSHHIASGVTRNGQSGEIGLKEHFRCVPPLAKCFDEIANYDLIIQKKDITTPFGVNLLGYHVDGFALRNYTNPMEAEGILQVMDHLLSNGYKLDDIGIISPFRNHIDALRLMICNKYHLPLKEGFAKEQIGTVHTFQGAERRVILFSTVLGYGPVQGLRMFEKPNLLNVAISRAQDLFILVGNTNVIHGVKNRYLDILMKHILANGKLVHLAEEVKEEKYPVTRLIQNCQHITVMERAIKDAKEEVIVIAPWLRQQPVDQFLNVVKDAPYHPKVHVLYGYDRFDKREPLEKMDDFVRTIQNTGGSVQNYATGPQRGTHEKIMIVDRRYAIVGSWNWLSHGYGDRCKEEFEDLKARKVMIRNETSVVTQDKNVISKLLERFQPVIEKA